MKSSLMFFALVMSVCPAIAGAATCSVANLTRCLDSVCAINVTSNPAARCQYCGTSSAGTPPTQNAMRSLSLGASARYTISADELEDAPTDPGQRYAWATRQCIAKIDGCTPDDVSDTYDELIEQSCRAAGVSAQLVATLSERAQETSLSACQSNITLCMVSETRCGADYRACENDTEFNEFFSQCSVQATGCDDYLSDIRTELASARDLAIEAADTMLASIVANYQQARDQKLMDAKNACTDNAAYNACIENVCETKMPNKCAGTSDSRNDDNERASAVALCEFYNTACATLD